MFMVLNSYKNTKGVSFTKTKLKSGATYYFTVKVYKTYKKIPIQVVSV